MIARINLVIFASTLFAVCWLWMQILHEFGHISAAVLTGGTITKVVLHPLQISRTDVDPNPFPLLVVWAGPVVGTILPLLLIQLMRVGSNVRKVSQFFAGFCLISNGAYIALGQIDRIGDCRIMLQLGTPAWVMFAYGLMIFVLGITMWHRLGSMVVIWNNPTDVPVRLTSIVVGLLLLTVIVQIVGTHFDSASLPVPAKN